MKKKGILTINSLNIGNRLQNYAMQTVLEKMGFYVETILREKSMSRSIKQVLRAKLLADKYTKFYDFNKTIHWSRCIVSNKFVTDKLEDKYDYFIVGSDQIWNPTFSFSSALDYLPMIDSSKKISYAASFGLSTIPDKFKDMVKAGLTSFENLSVREESGVQIIKELTGKDADITIDPTLFLDCNEWRKIAQPVCLDSVNRKYILKYFLGRCDENVIGQLAKEFDYDVIDATCKELPIGPAEFLYLIDNAELILTDSFHASVFSLVFKKPFIIFDRLGGENMTSRLDTFCKKFKLEIHRYQKGDTSFKLNNYEESYALLNEEKVFSYDFLKKYML